MFKNVFLILLALTLLACGEGVDFITRDVISDVASCYQSTEATDDTYLISLDKDCVDFELSGVGTSPLTPDATAPPPIAIPTDTEWEHIATLQRNPLKPGLFYLFDADHTAIMTAYLAGKHFIFEIGSENQGRRADQIRHYIIQTEPPFQDKHKDAILLAYERETGIKNGIHTYAFLSPDWYVPRQNVFGNRGEAKGLGIEFSQFIVDETDQSTAEIGLHVDGTSFIGVGRSFIHEWIRLRVYVSR